MASPIDTLVAAAERGGQPVWLAHGDVVLAEPAAARVAAALAKAGGCAVETHRRPAALAPLLDDLRTFSLFAAAKVVLAVDSAVFADKNAAADLIDAAREVLPLDATASRSLSSREREAASRLLQALHLFDVDPYLGTPEEVLSRLPDAALEGGGGRGGRARKGKADEARTALAGLLEAARREGLQGRGESDLAALADAVRDGLPPGHALVLAEREVAAGHPLVALLEERGTVARVGEVEATRRGGFQGLEPIARQLAEETGVAIAPDALAELARRTLRQEGDWRRSGRGEDETKAIGADSTARLAGEYRKLANIARGAGEGGRIERELVEESVTDRGEEDVWQLLDAIAEGRGGEALERLRRYLGAAEDETSARLAFFGLFAGFCRQLTAVRGLMRLAGVPGGESNYGRFKARHAPALQASLPTGGKNPVAGLHPFRLHRVYMAASRLPEPFLSTLPADVLETELQLKGESGEPDAALAGLIARVATAGRARTAR